MPLSNRVTPAGELVAVAARGLFLGNRGGRLHDAEGKLTAPRFISRRWICCQLTFRGRRRTVWGSGYTELFFLDEVTALAAGHRPCFECRRRDALAFAAAWAAAFALPSPPRAGEIDRILHEERLQAGRKRRHRLPADALPDGVAIAWPHAEPTAFFMRGEHLLRWDHRGYSAAVLRPRGVIVDVLTPPSIVAVLRHGYCPVWHPTALCQHPTATLPP